MEYILLYNFYYRVEYILSHFRMEYNWRGSIWKHGEGKWNREACFRKICSVWEQLHYKIITIPLSFQFHQATLVNFL